MRRRAGLALAAPLALLLGAADAGPVTFTIADHLSEGQLEETIGVAIDGEPVGTLRIDQAHPDDSFTVTRPAADRYAYALCGLLITRSPDGGRDQHPIRDAGTLTGTRGATFAAVHEGESRFALAPSDPSPAGARATRDGQARCPAAVAAQ